MRSSIFVWYTFLIDNYSQHGMMEKTFDQLTDENSKLKANLVALESQLQSQNQEIEEERETTAMFKAEAERDIKLQKQVLRVEGWTGEEGGWVEREG